MLTRGSFNRKFMLFISAVFLCLAFFSVSGYKNLFSIEYSFTAADIKKQPEHKNVQISSSQPRLDTAAYDQKLIELANNGTSTVSTLQPGSGQARSRLSQDSGGQAPQADSTTLTNSTYLTDPTSTRQTDSTSSPQADSTSSPQASSSRRTKPAPHLWPVKTVYPNAGAILPFNRIVAYYGNFYSAQMGVLGQYPAPQMLEKLRGAVAEWQAADPATPVMPALDYIAVTAQGSPGKDRKYRFRMPPDQIDKAIALAAEVNGLVFLDIQVGLSNLQTELPLLERYLKMPQVELSIDPEFSMKGGSRPGTVIGTFDAADINYAANYLASIVKENNLPPKILVVHRFTEDMVTRYKAIKPLPEVEIVMDMDGWGHPAKKLNTYLRTIYSEPVQFTGFKLFYRADLRPPSTRLLTPAELLKLKPRPSYIQYQ